jgi:hypothetical protein
MASHFRLGSAAHRRRQASRELTPAMPEQEAGIAGASKVTLGCAA